jgi:hypothetical protein
MRPVLRIGLFLALFSASAALGCGGSQAGAETPNGGESSGGTSDESGGEVAAPDKSFDDMNPGERVKFMKNVVVPEMEKLFVAHDAEEFSDFGCTTCHGPGANNGDYHMPTDSLPKLTKKLTESHPKDTEFMAKQVVPTMAKLLGEEPYSPETNSGFGCMGCHKSGE